MDAKKTLQRYEWELGLKLPASHSLILLPLRSWTSLYSLRFSSRTLWYPEAAWAKPRMCVPAKKTKLCKIQHLILQKKKIQHLIHLSENTKRRRGTKARKVEWFYHKSLPRLVNSSRNFICMNCIPAFVVWRVSFSSYKIWKAKILTHGKICIV